MDIHDFSSKIAESAKILSVSERAFLRTIMDAGCSEQILEEAARSMPVKDAGAEARERAAAQVFSAGTLPESATLPEKVAVAVKNLTVSERAFLRKVFEEDGAKCLKNSTPKDASPASVTVCRNVPVSPDDDEVFDLKDFTSFVAKAARSLTDEQKACLRVIFDGRTLDCCPTPGNQVGSCCRPGMMDLSDFSNKVAQSTIALTDSERALLKVMFEDVPARLR